MAIDLTVIKEGLIVKLGFVRSRDDAAAIEVETVPISLNIFCAEENSTTIKTGDERARECGSGFPGSRYSVNPWL